MPTEAHKRRYAVRRALKPGYPVTTPFKTRSEVNEYFSGDQITCLLCGRQFRELHVHLKKIHSKTVEWYREHYGLRWRRGLTCDELWNIHSLNRKEAIEGPEARKRLLADLANGRKAMQDSPPRFRKRPEYVIDDVRSNLYENEAPPEYGSDHAREFLSRVKSGRTFTEVASDGDMPSIQSVRRLRKRSPNIDAMFVRVLNALPFELQARIQCLGARFEAELRKCFDAGMSDRASAADLGVTEMTFNRRTQQWRLKPGMKPGTATATARTAT